MDDADATTELTADSPQQVVHAVGHKHVSAEHESTLELTSDDWLTPAGDCIVGIEADTTPAEFDDAFVAACQSATATITATFAVKANGETVTDTVVARGDPELSFEGDRSLVGRTSDYVDERTVFVGADKAAADLDRELVEALAGGAELTLTLTVKIDAR